MPLEELLKMYGYSSGGGAGGDDSNSKDDSGGGGDGEEADKAEQSKRKPSAKENITDGGKTSATPAESTEKPAAEKKVAKALTKDEPQTEVSNCLRSKSPILKSYYPCVQYST